MPRTRSCEGTASGRPDAGDRMLFEESMSSSASTCAFGDSGTWTASWSPSKSALNAGQTSGSTVVTDLAPGTYTVSEDPIVGWTIDGNQSADITLPSCSGNVTFNNVRHASDLVVTKTATTSYNRAFNWNIQKSVDKTKVDQVGFEPTALGLRVPCTARLCY